MIPSEKTVPHKKEIPSPEMPDRMTGYFNFKSRHFKIRKFLLDRHISPGVECIHFLIVLLSHFSDRIPFIKKDDRI